MPSKLDNYLNNAPSKELETIKEQGKTLNNNTNSVENTSYKNEPVTPVPNSNKVDSTQPKLNQETIEHIQNVNDGEGNNYLTQKDSLGKYAVNQSNIMQDKSLEQDHELDR